MRIDLMKAKYFSEKQGTKEEKKPLEQWKKEKSDTSVKKAGACFLRGIAHGLTMYGHLSACVFLPMSTQAQNNYINSYDRKFTKKF